MHALSFDLSEWDIGTYGPNCSYLCPEGCAPYFNKATGHCQCANRTNVSPGCKECPTNCHNGCNEDLVCSFCKYPYYGSSCDAICPATCLMGGRHGCRQDGTCETCAIGYYGASMSCPHRCPSNCLDSVCNKESGACITCRNGWTGPKCDQGIY